MKALDLRTFLRLFSNTNWIPSDIFLISNLVRILLRLWGAPIKKIRKWVVLTFLDKNRVFSGHAVKVGIFPVTTAWQRFDREQSLSSNILNLFKNEIKRKEKKWMKNHCHAFTLKMCQERLQEIYFLKPLLSEFCLITSIGFK